MKEPSCDDHIKFKDTCHNCKRCKMYLAEGHKLGREEERAAIVAWLRGDKPLLRYGEEAWCAAELIERADHLRPDIKGGEGET